MRRMRYRGPSAADLNRQARVRKLLCQYGAYSRQSAASSSLECSTSLASTSSRSAQLASTTSALQLATANRRAGQLLHEDADVKLSISRPSQLVGTRDLGQMDKGLALAAAQYVSKVLASGESNGVESQQMKEDFLHQLEQDWGFAGSDNLSLGKIKITIKRRDNDIENIRRRAELERAELERSRLEARAVQSRNVQAVSSSQVSSSSTTKVVKTRVVKTTKRTVQTVRAA